jgi:hypothetical protein
MKKIAIVVKGYCETPQNQVFAIYDLHRDCTCMIPTNGIMDIHEACDVLGDAVSLLKENGYNVLWDIREQTEFDVTKMKPSVEIITL